MADMRRRQDKTRERVSGRRPARRMSSRMKKKLTVLFIAVIIFIILLAVRISSINAQNGSQYARQVLSQSQSEYSSVTLPFKRGDIYDANGLTLATSEKRYNVILDCRVVNSDESYIEPTIKALTENFDIKEKTIREKLTDEETCDSQYQVILRDVTVEAKTAFEEYKSPSDPDSLSKKELEERNCIKGIWFEEDYVRTYPMGSLACDVLGFTNGDNSADWGIEGYYTNTLNGVDGRKYGYWSDEDELSQTIIAPTDGSFLVTTLDANIQKIVEDEIASFNERYSDGPYYEDKGAENVGVIVMDPNDGSILAMASSDPYDLNDPRDLTPFYTDEQIKAMSEEEKVEALQDIWRNFCISDTYEPGSVVKPVTVSAALESGSIKETDQYVCDGGQTVAGTYIKCSENDGHGEETLADVIRNSCNDAVMQIVDKVGVETFCEYQRLFNFGSRTGIDLSGEASGILYEADSMGEVDLATSAFGQGFTCTMIQEAAAISSVINGGYYYQPQVVRSVLASDGSTIKNNDPVLLKQTISTDVSDTLRSYMKGAVDGGTAIYAKVNGYSMGGKTGTAQKLPRGNGKYIVSFIGFAPYDDPQVLIYVIVDEPNAADQADSRYPQWIAKNILTQVLPYMGIYPDEELVEENPILLEPDKSADVDASEAENDTPEDTNVPTLQDTGAVDNADPNGGNTPQTDGITNEEAGIT